MDVSRKNKITNVEILCRAALPSMADILIEKNLRHVRLLGHMHRMDSPIIRAAVAILIARKIRFTPNLLNANLVQKSAN